LKSETFLHFTHSDSQKIPTTSECFVFIDYPFHRKFTNSPKTLSTHHEPRSSTHRNPLKWKNSTTAYSKATKIKAESHTRIISQRYEDKNIFHYFSIVPSKERGRTATSKYHNDDMPSHSNSRKTEVFILLTRSHYKKFPQPS